MGPGSSTNRDIRNITDIGRVKPLIDWRYVLREAIKYYVDWSYRNAAIENGVISANLEEQPIPETEIVLDTSGSINETLLKNFLRECKNILQHSRLKVGCLRVIIWKQWKKIKKRYSSLRKLGMSHRDAYVTANSRRWYYRIAHTRVLETAISKERLNKRGLVNSLDYYLKVHIITN